MFQCVFFDLCVWENTFLLHLALILFSILLTFDNILWLRLRTVNELRDTRHTYRSTGEARHTGKKIRWDKLSNFCNSLWLSFVFGIVNLAMAGWNEWFKLWIFFDFTMMVDNEVFFYFLNKKLMVVMVVVVRKNAECYCKFGDIFNWNTTRTLIAPFLSFHFRFLIPLMFIILSDWTDCTVHSAPSPWKL